jgi:hypothetical protein
VNALVAFVLGAGTATILIGGALFVAAVTFGRAVDDNIAWYDEEGYS